MLADLTEQFIRSNFDFKYLIRAITASAAYQRSSMMTHPSQKDLHWFARMPLRGLTGEQLFDSLATATGYREAAAPQPQFAAMGRGGSPRAEFLTRFATQDRKTETQTSILQALALMNGRFISDATSLSKSATLAAVVEAPFMDNAARLETLFLAALSRPPRPEERERLLSYVERGGATGNQAEALADVFWALLNTSEFLFNH